MRFADDNPTNINWPKIWDAVWNPKKDENGEEYIDVSPTEMTAVNDALDKFAALCKITNAPENPEAPLSARREYDARFQAEMTRQFAHLNTPKAVR